MNNINKLLKLLNCRNWLLNKFFFKKVFLRKLNSINLKDSQFLTLKNKHQYCKLHQLCTVWYCYFTQIWFETLFYLFAFLLWYFALEIISKKLKKFSTFLIILVCKLVFIECKTLEKLKNLALNLQFYLVLI